MVVNVVYAHSVSIDVDRNTAGVLLPARAGCHGPNARRHLARDGRLLLQPRQHGLHQGEAATQKYFPIDRVFLNFW